RTTSIASSDSRSRASGCSSARGRRCFVRGGRCGRPSQVAVEINGRYVADLVEHVQGRALRCSEGGTEWVEYRRVAGEEVTERRWPGTELGRAVRGENDLPCIQE